MKFTYQATNPVGEIVRGEMEAPDKEHVFSALAKKNLTPVSIKKAGPGISKGKFEISFGGHLSPIDKILLAKRFGAALKAGIPMVETLNILIADTKNPNIKKMLAQIRLTLERGETLASAFAAFPKEFSPVFIGLIRAGESAGTLDKSLEEIALRLRREYTTKQSVKSAMIYPIILVLAASVIMVVMVTFVLPKVTVAFEQSGIELPFITKMLLQIGNTFSSNPIMTLGGFFGLLVVGFLGVMSRQGRRLIGKIIIHVPVFSDLIKQQALARFAGILSTLLRSGVPAVEALQITAESIGNEDYKKEILRTQENIKKGMTIADSLREREKLFPHMLLSMIAIGEKSGTLDETLGTLAEFYEEEVDRLIKNVLALLEPGMLLMMGLGIGLIAVSILMPIYKMVSGIQ